MPAANVFLTSSGHEVLEARPDRLGQLVFAVRRRAVGWCPDRMRSVSFSASLSSAAIARGLVVGRHMVWVAQMVLFRDGRAAWRRAARSAGG